MLDLIVCVDVVLHEVFGDFLQVDMGAVSYRGVHEQRIEVLIVCHFELGEVLLDCHEWVIKHELCCMAILD